MSTSQQDMSSSQQGWPRRGRGDKDEPARNRTEKGVMIGGAAMVGLLGFVLFKRFSKRRERLSDDDQ